MGETVTVTEELYEVDNGRVVVAAAINEEIPVERYDALVAAGVQPAGPKDDHPHTVPGPETPEGYAAKTKAELLELAADADIDGRSSMTKDELIAALEEADQA